MYSVTAAGLRRDFTAQIPKASKPDYFSLHMTESTIEPATMRLSSRSCGLRLLPAALSHFGLAIWDKPIGI